MKRLLLVSLFFLGLHLAAAAPLERDLGARLGFVRLHHLPADLPAQPAGKATPCVVDIRYVESDADGAAAFVAWLKFRATPRSPVFVLANAATTSALLKPLGPADREAGIVVVGLEAAQFRPDIPARGTAETERLAYDALEDGVEIATLLADNPTKVRHDEASLAKDRVGDLPPGISEDTGTGKSPTVLVDATLQRAVHLHRALVAMKKL